MPLMRWIYANKWRREVCKAALSLSLEKVRSSSANEFQNVGPAAAKPETTECAGTTSRDQ